MSRGDCANRRVADIFGLAERAVRFDGDAALKRVPRERCLLKARLDLELIHCGHNRSLGEDAIEVWLEEVRDPDRPDDSSAYSFSSAFQVST